MANTSSETTVQCQACIDRQQDSKVYLVLEHFDEDVVVRMYQCDKGHGWEEVEDRG